MSHLVALLVLFPLLVGILLIPLGSRAPSLSRLLSLASAVVQIALALALHLQVSAGQVLVYALGNWQAPFGIVLVADRLAVWMILITTLLAFFALLYACRGVDQAGPHFHALFQLQLFGLSGAFLTGDLFNLFVFFEVLLLASYGLLLHGGGRARTRAGLHFVVINLAGSSLFLLAAGTLYGMLGTLNMADMAHKMAAVPPEDLGLVHAGGLLLFVVFALKGALLPLYLWLPAAYAHTSAPVAALFAVMTKVGAYSILRLASLVFGSEAGSSVGLIEPWLLPLALATLIGGMLGALASSTLRQQIAYLVIASVGTLLTAFGLGTVEGLAAGIFYLPHATFAAAAFFLLADSIAARRGSLEDRLEPCASMDNTYVLGGLFFVMAVLLGGLPPLSGFLAKALILQAAAGHGAMPWVLGTVLLTSLFAIIALARSGSLIFYRTSGAEQPKERSGLGPLSREVTPAVGLLMLCLGLVLWAGPLHDYARSMAQQLSEPHQYIQAVLPSTGGTP